MQIGNTVADTLASHIVSASFDRIPETTIEAAKRAIIDSIGVAWAGTAERTCPEVYRALLSCGGRPDATVWPFGTKLPAASCAYINSLFASALDYDTIHAEAVMHSDIVVLPAAWAIAEQQHASGREFLTAYVVGSDLACRLGLATTKSAGWFYTSVLGVFGAAAAASKLLHHDERRMRNALALAFLQASGSYQCVLERSLAKRHLSALAARSGVFAAILANSDVEGPAEVFEGKFGLHALFGTGNPAKLVEALGERYESANVSFKYYPCCYCSHAAIEGILSLERTHGYIEPTNIQRVTVVLSPYMAELVGGPFTLSDADPQVTAQFSVRYAVAVAVLRRRFSLADLEPAAISDPRVREIANLVEVQLDLESQATVTPVDVILSTRDGHVYKQRVETIPGMPERSLTDAELVDKFFAGVTRGAAPLGRQTGQKLLQRIRHLDAVPDMQKFFDENDDVSYPSSPWANQG